MKLISVQQRAVHIMLLVVFLCIGKGATAATVGYWRFEEGAENAPATGSASVLDSSGNGHHATPINSPIYRSNVPVNPVGGTGASNLRSLEFNGTDQRVFVPDSPQFELTHSLTLEAFVYVHPLIDPNFAGEIVYRGDDRGGLDPYALAVLPDGNFDLRIDSETDEFHLQAPIPSYEKWHHVAGILDDATGQVMLYVDGALAASSVTSTRPFGALDPARMPGLGIGNVQSDNYAVHFNGLIDEVRISDVALLPSQFLNAPEPTSLALLALPGALAVAELILCYRRTRPKVLKRIISAVSALFVLAMCVFSAGIPAYGRLIYSESWEGAVLAPGGTIDLPSVSFPLWKEEPFAQNSSVARPEPASLGTEWDFVDPLSSPAEGSHILVLPDGGNQDNGVYAVLPTKFAAKTIYSLTVAVGRNAAQADAGEWSIQLWADANANDSLDRIAAGDTFLGQACPTSVACSSISPQPGRWQTNGLQFNTLFGPTVLGQSIIVFLNNFATPDVSTSTVYFDNIRLEIVPEPITLLSVSIAAFCLILHCRTRRR